MVMNLKSEDTLCDNFFFVFQEFWNSMRKNKQKKYNN